MHPERKNVPRCERDMTIYLLMRDEDVSGRSGIGVVAEVFEASTGSVHLFWRREPFGETRYSNLAELLSVHGHGGRTYLVMIHEVTSEMLELALEQPTRFSLEGIMSKDAAA